MNWHRPWFGALDIRERSADPVPHDNSSFPDPEDDPGNLVATTSQTSPEHVFPATTDGRLARLEAISDFYVARVAAVEEAVRTVGTKLDVAVAHRDLALAELAGLGRQAVGLMHHGIGRQADMIERIAALELPSALPVGSAHAGLAAAVNDLEAGVAAVESQTDRLILNAARCLAALR